MADLLPCPFCSKTMMLRSALWPSEGDADAIIHAFPTDCPMVGFSDGSADGSIIEKWNCSLSNEDDFPSDGSCVRCGSVPRNANGLCNTCLDEDAERLENTRPAPAATDTGLVTLSVELTPSGHPYMKSDPEGDYVTRSQAEELLTAERAEKEELDAECRVLAKRCIEKDARIKELEGINANLIGDDEDKPRYTTKRLKHEIARATEALEAKIASKDGWKELHDAAQVAVKERTEACNSLYKQVATLEAKLAAAQEALEPFALISSEGVIKQETGHVTVITCAEYFHKARAARGGKPS